VEHLEGDEMYDSVPPNRLTRPLRARQLAAAALLSAVLVAGCGGGSGSPTVANVGSPTTSTSSRSDDTTTPATSRIATTSQSSTATSNGGASSSPPTQASLEADELAFARCMRANGVPNFPDPSAEGGFKFAVPVGGPSSPVFRAAQSKCNKLLPGGGLAGPGSGPAPSAQALAHWVRVAQCMRRHGVFNFPDPRTTVPSHPPSGGGVISDRDGVILVFPHTIDEQSALFTRAAAACGFQLTNH
jgi:hypothetical protein